MTWRHVLLGYEVVDSDGLAVALVATEREARDLIREIEKE